MTLYKLNLNIYYKNDNNCIKIQYKFCNILFDIKITIKNDYWTLFMNQNVIMNQNYNSITKFLYELYSFLTNNNYIIMVNPHDHNNINYSRYFSKYVFLKINDMKMIKYYKETMPYYTILFHEKYLHEYSKIIKNFIKIVKLIGYEFKI